MISVIKISITAILPVLATLVFCILLNKSLYLKKHYWISQISIGVVFGIIAIICTEFGIEMQGFYINCRDAAPVAAGLIFGGPAGIIAGVLGGAERWLSNYWGTESFTRVACSLATFLAGVFTALVRKYIFDFRKPRVIVAFECGVVMEIMHMTLIFLTNISDMYHAIEIISVCFVPMVFAVGISVFVSVAIAKLLDQFFVKEVYSEENTLREKLQTILLINMAIVTCLIILVNAAFQNKNAAKKLEEDLSNAIDQTIESVDSVVETDMLKNCRIIAQEINNGEKDLAKLADLYHVTEVNVINDNYVIIESNVNEYINYYMYMGEQSTDFMENAKHGDYIQPYMRTSADNEVFRRYVGVKLDEGRFLQIGYNDEDYKRLYNSWSTNIAKNVKIGNNGGIIIYDLQRNELCRTADVDLSGEVLRKDNGNIEDILEGHVYKVTINEEDYAIQYGLSASGIFLGIEPLSQVYADRNLSIYVTIFVTVNAFVVLFGIVYIVMGLHLVNNIRRVDESLSQIASGNTDILVDIQGSQEFISLSESINDIVDTVKKQIDTVEQCIDDELSFAKNIQQVALPTVSSAGTSRTEYDMYSVLYPTKLVGGDFYDFYFSDNDCLNFAIGDVCDKGKKAVLLMMKAKSILKSNTQRLGDLDEAFYQSNMQLCYNNDEQLFVTAWQGKIDLKTGKMFYVNAGQGKPLIKHRDGSVEYLQQKTEVALACHEGTKYQLNTAQLKPGDILFLYTDGVIQAKDVDGEIYGADRLLKNLSNQRYISLKEMCDYVKRDIDIFCKGAPLQDDIVMLAIIYNGGE